MKFSVLKQSINAFISGLLISTLSVVPVLNVSASTASISVRKYFSSTIGVMTYYYYNYAAITTGRNVNNEPFAIATTNISRNDSHTFFAGEVGVFEELYNESGARICESSYFLYNGSNDTTFFTRYIIQTNIPTNTNYYARGKTRTYSTAPEAYLNYVEQTTYYSPHISDFTY